MEKKRQKMWAASAMLTVNAPRALMFCAVLCVSVRFRTTESRSWHGAPCGVHHIHAAVLVISRNHQNRHRENALGNFQICSHDNSSL